MATVERTLALLLLTVTLRSVTVVEGCPKSAIVDLTNASSNSSGFVDESGGIFPFESIHSENDQTYGCICDIKACVPLCCPEGHALSAELECVEDQFTPNHSYHQEWWFHSLNYYKFVENPCKELTLLTSLRISVYYLLTDNSILIPEEERIVGLGRYCVFREPNSSSHTSTLICQNYFELIDLPTCFLVSNSVSILFMLVTIVVYCVIPKLKNLQGWILRSFLASYICGLIVFTAIHLEIASLTYMSEIISGKHCQHGHKTFLKVIKLNKFSFVSSLCTLLPRTCLSDVVERDELQRLANVSVSYTAHLRFCALYYDA